VVDGLRAVLKNGGVVADDFDIVRSLPHGHVAAVKAVMDELKIDRLISSTKSSERSLVLAMIAARILFPGSKLATAREFSAPTATSTLGEEFGLPGIVSEDDLYTAMDWLLPRQKRIEKKLSSEHLANNTLVLYDLTSSYVEGRCCPLPESVKNRRRSVGDHLRRTTCGKPSTDLRVCLRSAASTSDTKHHNISAPLFHGFRLWPNVAITAMGSRGSCRLSLVCCPMMAGAR
jgi:hypothetical protein